MMRKSSNRVAFLFCSWLLPSGAEKRASCLTFIDQKGILRQ
ncbi:hypothetical protein GCWU000182_00483 [Abiotrophia defectiva ATCC 49176]|uniref:Uncharacterized protein n=1 Tax=Abiotrophia defectiva ATCC 49176 TaxID=592010 RepID=W1Q4H2_ABIDE|nr:hypothetical protein GCWU000182_00483 [Abiotrophia defectiva ATCC 49176]